ncbi:MAG: hypothetical protein RQ715_00055 [Methylococcales bacterium]|nr:hypothetical protein [Methylococcales bacterium]
MFEEFHYRLPWRTRSAHPGHHASVHSGGEHEFRGHAPLMSRPLAQHIDIHASLLDPFGQFMVRTFKQQGRATVQIVADLSASMGFHRKMQTLARFTELTAFSAFRTGDHFAFAGAGDDWLPELALMPRWYKGGVSEFAEQLSQFQPESATCRGLLAADRHCPRERSLVFLVSDFHLPEAFICQMLDELLHHDVIPVVLWHDQEYQSLPEWGLLRLHDAETGQDKTLWLRPGLKRKIEAHFERRKQALRHIFSRYPRQPLFLNENFTADQLTRYFYEQ